MFLFGKKKKEEAPKEDKPKVDYTQLENELGEKEKALDTLTGSERIKLLNELGSGYMEALNVDKAIQFYETSLNESQELGKAYTDLMKLYNIKRRTATEEKNDEQMKYYMDKIEELMKLSKDVIRGRA